MSFRQIVRVEPGKSVKISFVTAVANSREDVVEMATKFKSPQVIKDELGMAVTKSRVEARYLNLDTEEIELYQDMISHILFISPLQRQKQKWVMNNKKDNRVFGLMVFREIYRLYLSCLTKPMT